MPKFEHPDRKNIDAAAKKFADTQAKVIATVPADEPKKAAVKAETKG